MTPGRWLIAAVLGAAAAAVIMGVVITRATSGSGSSAKSLPVSTNLIRGGNLGDVGDELALRAKLEPTLLGSSRASTARSSDLEPRCAAAAHKLQPPGAVRVYQATAAFKGARVDVFGFSPPGAPATSSRGRPTPTRVYVLAQADCRLLVFQSFAP
ncbi:MAG: hypothetical protein JO155_11870 [Acidimicrobiia bacterium]|nr:hypothetical protein [Acidimicrobiia bacterium]